MFSVWSKWPQFAEVCLDITESACQCRKCKRFEGSIPESGRSPAVGNGNPFQYSCLGNPMDRTTWWATVHKESDMTEQLSTQAQVIMRSGAFICEQGQISVTLCGGLETTCYGLNVCVCPRFTCLNPNPRASGCGLVWRHSKNNMIRRPMS